MRCLAKVFQCHKFEPEVEFVSSNSSSSNNSNSENEDFIICHDKLLLDCYNTIVKKRREYLIEVQCKECINVQRDVGNLPEPLLAESDCHCSLNLKYKLNFRLKLMALEHLSQAPQFLGPFPSQSSTISNAPHLAM